MGRKQKASSIWGSGQILMPFQASRVPRPAAWWPRIAGVAPLGEPGLPGLAGLVEVMGMPWASSAIPSESVVQYCTDVLHTTAGERGEGPRTPTAVRPAWCLGRAGRVEGSVEFLVQQPAPKPHSVAPDRSSQPYHRSQMRMGRAW